MDKLKDIILGNARLKRWSAKIYSLFHGNRINITLDNAVYKDYAFLRNVRITIKGKSNIIKIEDVSILKNCDILISGNHNSIILGEKTVLYDVALHIEDDGNTIKIGDHTTIFGKTHLACIEGCSIIIGNDCMFSSDVVFRTGDTRLRQ